jgi:hypothetical protein
MSVRPASFFTFASGRLGWNLQGENDWPPPKKKFTRPSPLLKLPFMGNGDTDNALPTSERTVPDQQRREKRTVKKA